MLDMISGMTNTAMQSSVLPVGLGHGMVHCYSQRLLSRPTRRINAR